MDTEDTGQDQTFEEFSEAGNSQVIDSEQQEQPQEQDTGGVNPVWDPIRNELGVQFETIKPHLLDIDKGFNEGITKANAKYAPWKQFDESGLTPDTIQQQLQVVQALNDRPEEIYQALGQFLEQNGRLPKNAEEAQQALDDVQEDDPYQSEEAKQIAEMRKQLEDQQQFLQAQVEQQHREQLEEKANQEVAQEYDAFEKAHPELSEQDKQDIYQRHYLYAASGPQNMKTLEEVYKEHLALVERVRSVPRPNDLAPRLPGAGGGVPTGQRKDPSEYSRNESQDALAALVQQAQNNQ